MMSRAKRRNWLAIQSHIRKHPEKKIEDEKEKVRGGGRQSDLPMMDCHFNLLMFLIQWNFRDLYLCPYYFWFTLYSLREPCHIAVENCYSEWCFRGVCYPFHIPQMNMMHRVFSIQENIYCRLDLKESWDGIKRNTNMQSSKDHHHGVSHSDLE